MRKKWWAGTGLNRRHQDFQVLEWLRPSAAIGHHWEGFQALGLASVSPCAGWHTIVADGSDTTLTQQLDDHSPAPLAAVTSAPLGRSPPTRPRNLALRQQLAVYNRTVTRPPLRRTDRLFWVGLATVWAGWRQSLVIVTPNTVPRLRGSVVRADELVQSVPG